MPNQWRPISQAPKDGPILGYANDEMAVVAWEENPPHKGYWSLVVFGTWAEDSEWTPTHFMFLPEPPNIEGA